MKHFEKSLIPIVTTAALLMSGYTLATTLLKPRPILTVAVLDTQRILDRQKMKWLHVIRENSGDTSTMKRIETEAKHFDKTLHVAVDQAIEKLPESEKPQLVLEARAVLSGHSQPITDLTPVVLSILRLDKVDYENERKALLRDLFNEKGASS